MLRCRNCGGSNVLRTVYAAVTYNPNTNAIETVDLDDIDSGSLNWDCKDCGKPEIYNDDDI